MSAPFIGRAKELATLSRALPDNADRRGRFIAIAGDPGIGKTRMMAEIASLAEVRELGVLWSQTIEDPVAPPYFAWMLLLRAALQEYSDDALIEDAGCGAVDLADVIPELRDRMTLPPSRPAGGGAAARYQIYDAVTRFLLAAAKRRPLVLLFDNLHLADRSSIEMLEHYCHQITASSVLVVAAYRDAELQRNGPLRSALTRLSRNSGYERLELSGLLRDEVAALLQLRTGKPPPAALVDTVFEQSDGNPLFVSEVGDVLKRRAPSTPMPVSGFNFKVPASLHEVIAARLDSLSPESFRMLGLAAVLGRDFDANALAVLAGSSNEDTLKRLEPAEAVGIVAALRPGCFRFHHALYREVLYAGHGTMQRAELHSKAAHHLEQRCTHDAEPHLSELAYHYFESAQAGHYRKAVDYCRRAAEMAIGRRAFGEAAVLLDRSLQAAELGPEPNDELKFELLSALGQAQFRAWEVLAACETLLKPALLAHRKQWWSRLAEAVIAFQSMRAQMCIGHVAAVPLHETAIKHLAPDSIPLKARLLASLAIAYRLAGKSEAADTTLRNSILLARECGDEDVLMFCLGVVPRILVSPVCARERVTMLSEALVLARKNGERYVVLEAIKSLPGSLCDLGEIAEVQQLIPEVRQLASEERHLHNLNVVAGFETALAILQGRWLDAIRHATEVLRRAPLMGVVGLEGRFGFQMFAIHKAKGELNEVAQAADRIIGASDASSMWLPGQILLHCELGQTSRARTALARLGKIDNVAVDDMFLISLVYLAEACTWLRDASRCGRLYELLLPYRGLNVNMYAVVMLGAVSGFLAPMAALLRRPKEARSMFEEAIEMNTRMGALPALARNCVDYADMLLESNRLEDHTHARQLLGQAAPIAGALELKPVLAIIDRLEEDAASGRLTGREIDVLTLIAAGASNKKISGTLHISYSTVATHVRNILRKIGASNRTEAAEYARRSNLLSTG